MERITLFVNLALVALVMAAPFIITYGFEKQERIEGARRGQ